MWIKYRIFQSSCCIVWFEIVLSWWKYCILTQSWNIHHNSFKTFLFENNWWVEFYEVKIYIMEIISYFRTFPFSSMSSIICKIIIDTTSTTSTTSTTIKIINWRDRRGKFISRYFACRTCCWSADGQHCLGMLDLLGQTTHSLLRYLHQIPGLDCTRKGNVETSFAQS